MHSALIVDAEASGWPSQLSIRLLISDPVMISRFVMEPQVRFCVGGAEPAWDSLSFPFSALTLLVLSLSLSLSKINKLDVYLFLREIESGRGAESERETIPSRL